jgi:hypothetical protein
MLFSKALLFALPVLAMAAPANEPRADDPKDFGDAPAAIAENYAIPDPNILVTPTGYITLDDGQFHEGEYKAAAKRDLAEHQEEKRLFGLTLLLLGGLARGSRERLYYTDRYPNHIYAPYGGWWYDGYRQHYGRPSYFRPCRSSGWCAGNGPWY